MTQRAVLALLVGFLSACTGTLPPLSESDRPLERASAPVESGLWEGLEAVRTDNWFRLLNTGPEALEWRLRVIDSATDSLDLQTFIWQADAVGSRILERVLAAADRGVRVRVLLDDAMLAGADSALFVLDRHPNIEYRIFNPAASRAQNAILRELLNTADFARIDHRMHNKVLIVDDRSAIVGGRNLANEYFGYDPSYNFRDMEVLAVGPVASALSTVFDRYWNNPWAYPVALVAAAPDAAYTLETLRREIDTLALPYTPESSAQRQTAWLGAARVGVPGEVHVVADAPARGDPDALEQAPVQVADRLRGLVENADTEVIIISAYFIPTPALDTLIRSIGEQGVELRILTNSLAANNHAAAHSAYRRHRRTLLEAGALLHETRALSRDRQRYMAGPVGDRKLGLHAKVMLVDRTTSFIGSANFDPRSLRINTEMGLLIESEAMNRAVRSALETDFERANAWQLLLDGDDLMWISDDRVLRKQPAGSFVERIEDWFFGLLPIESEM